jgi:hypothetical protein
MGHPGFVITNCKSKSSAYYAWMEGNSLQCLLWIGRLGLFRVDELSKNVRVPAS